jgi:putative DNA primase/helicase
MGLPRIRRDDSTPDNTPSVRELWTTSAALKAAPTQWLVPGRIPCNGITLIEGHMASGKSTLLASLVAAITRGRAWLTRRRTKPRGVLWLAGEEDPAGDVRPRLEAAGAETTRVHHAAHDEHGTPLPVRLPGSLSMLREAILTLDLAVIVLDPLASYIASDVDLHSETAVRAVLDPLHALAVTTSCAVIATRHLRKDTSGPRILQGLGSVAVGSIARAILHVDHPDHGSPRRVLRPVKCSRARLASPAEFTIDGASLAPSIVNLRELDPTAESAADQERDPAERDVARDAETMLRGLLGTEGVTYAVVMRHALACGVSERTLRRVKTALGVRSKAIRSGGEDQYYWLPPSGGW